MSEEGIPPKEWYHFRDWLTRTDEELELLIKLNKEVVNLLKIAVAELPTPIGWKPVTDRLDKLLKMVDRDYPDLINEVDIDTSITTWKELKIRGTGFSIEAIGGGFNIKVPDNQAKELTTTVGDKYDFTFTNMFVKGAGAGTGRIKYWRKK